MTEELMSRRIVIYKSRRKLELFDGERLVKTFPIALGFEPAGHKQAEGDGRTPEGDYFVFVKNPKSKFTAGLGISYPGPDDASRGLGEGSITPKEYEEIRAAAANTAGPPQKTALGGEIYIHGGGTETDWTRGCVGLADDEIREVFDLIPVGARVTILP